MSDTATPPVETKATSMGPISGEDFKNFSTMIDHAISLRNQIVRNKDLMAQLNEDQFKRFELICHQSAMSRAALLKTFSDPRRNINQECGYPETGSCFGAWPYADLYFRNPIANRVVQLPAKKMWEVQPHVYESTDPKKRTLFEKAWLKLNQTILPGGSGSAGGNGPAGGSWYIGASIGEGSSIFQYLERVDALSRIGTFGILLMGINDGRSLEQPVAGSVVYNEASKQWNRTDVSLNDTGGFGDHYMTTNEEKIIETTHVPHAFDFIQGKPILSPRLLSVEESGLVQKWKEERDLIISVNRVFPGVCNIGIAKQVAHFIINQVGNARKVNRSRATPHPSQSPVMRGRREGPRGSSNPTSGGYVSDLTGPGISSYAPEGSYPPNNSGYAFHDEPANPSMGFEFNPKGGNYKQFQRPESAPGNQGSSPFQVPTNPSGGSSPFQIAQELFDQPNSSGWDTPRKPPQMTAYQYGRSDGWGQYGQSGESGWASVGLPVDAQPNNPRDSGYAPQFANGDIAYKGFGAPPLNPGVPQPFGGMQYSSGYAVTPEGFAMTPGGPQALLPASILSGTDQQYYGVQFGPTELPSPGIDPVQHKLMFLRAYDERLVQVVRYEWNIRNPRFGLPVMYRVTLNDPLTQHSGVGLPLATVFVHWSRILHVADVHANASPSEVFSIPPLMPILNQLLDLDKLYAGSAEMYWKGAFPGLAFETHPELGGDVDVDVAGTQQMMQQYENGLQRYLTLTGMRARSIAPQVVDPVNQIEVHLEAIAIQIGWPKRSLTGSEKGQLASSQDKGETREVLTEREKNYGTPLIMVPLIDRLIKLGVLPPPKVGYRITWPARDTSSDKDKSIVSVGWVKALSQYYASGLAQLIPPMEFFTTVMKLTEEEAKAIVDAGEKWLKQNFPTNDLPGSPPKPVYGIPPQFMAMMQMGGAGLMGGGAQPGGGIGGSIPGMPPMPDAGNQGKGSPLSEGQGSNLPFFGRRAGEQQKSEGSYVGNTFRSIDGSGFELVFHGDDRDLELGI